MKKIKKGDLVVSEHVPLYYRYMLEDKIKENESPTKTTEVEIEFYQTKSFEVYPFYNNISKIVKIKNDK